MNEDDLRAKHYVKNADGSWSKPRTAAAHNAPQVGHSQLHPSENPLVEVSRPGRPLAAEGKRIRQDRKPLLNKLETEWLELLKQSLPAGTKIHAQEWRVKISNGAWFKVDFCAMVGGVWTAWECKGPKTGKNVARGMLALKCACSAFPEVQWNLVWKEGKSWNQQILLP